MKKVSKTGVHWLFLATVLLCVMIYGIGLLLKKTGSPERIHRGFIRMIREAERNTEIRKKRIDDLLDRPDLQKEVEKILPLLHSEENFAFSDFLFRNDSLIWWSDHKEILKPSHSLIQDTGFRSERLAGGWVCISTSSRGSATFLTLIKIKNEFPIHNRFLESQFAKGFNVPSQVRLTEKKTRFPVTSRSGKYLFSLDFSTCDNMTSQYDVLTGITKRMVETLSAVLFFLAGILFYCSLWYLFKKFAKGKRENSWFILFFTIIILSRSFQGFLRFPGIIYELELFRPVWYSSSQIFPSPGDLLLNLAIIIWVLYLIYKKEVFMPLLNSKSIWKTGGIIIWTLLLAGIHIWSVDIVSSLVLDSSFPMNFQNIAEFSPISTIGLSIVILVTILLGLFSLIAWDRISAASYIRFWYTMPFAIAGIGFGVFHLLLPEHPVLLSMFSFVGFGMVYLFVFIHRKEHFTLQQIIWALIGFSLFNTVVLYQANQRKTDFKISLFALKVTSGHNPVTEQKYEEVAKKITQDSELQEFIFSEMNMGLSDSMIQKLKKKYFDPFWARYNIQFTLCKPGNQLLIQPHSYLNDCQTYFNNIIQTYGKITTTKGLFCLDYGYGLEYYLGILNFNKKGKNEDKSATIYLELTLNGTDSEPGYPSLLLDNEKDNIPGLTDFSFALYRNGALVHSVGNLLYPLEIPERFRSVKAKQKFETSGESDYYFRINKDTELLVGYRNNKWLSLFTQISYLFILFAMTATLITGLAFLAGGKRSNIKSLRVKLQLLLTGMILVTMIVLGLIQIKNIIKINQIKNYEYLREKGFSVKSEFQQVFGSAINDQDILKQQPENFLTEMANVFFTDINFYNSGGKLVSSSRMRIFREGLVSDRINPVAYERLLVEKKPLIILEEQIGSLVYASAYLPLFNDNGNLLGFINLPYFARQDALKNEITSFLVTFANIYIFLILAGVVISILISNYLAAPFVILSGKLGLMNPAGKNEKITWNSQDEIGDLVDIYNKKVDELENHVRQLAISEREKAWRTMARQVAHEIKNPLTPMKLSAQHLQKAALDGANDLNFRIERFLKTLIEQIDELAIIASDFSTFAKMPDPEPEWFNLADQIKLILEAYQDDDHLRYNFQVAEGKYEIFEDRPRFSRILKNLLNNATQAMVPDRPGMITVILHQETDYYILYVKDNGSGISAETAERIFQPEFTTKSSGMGLGLAIVKELVKDMNGEINFQSEPGKGSTFIVKIPANTKINNAL